MSNDLIFLIWHNYSSTTVAGKMRMVFHSSGEMEKNNVKRINHFMLCTCSYHNNLWNEKGLCIQKGIACVLVCLQAQYQLLQKIF